MGTSWDRKSPDKFQMPIAECRMPNAKCLPFDIRHLKFESRSGSQQPECESGPLPWEEPLRVRNTRSPGNQLRPLRFRLPLLPLQRFDVFFALGDLFGGGG